MSHAYAHLVSIARPNRAYLQAFIVLRDIDIPSIDAYADKLANEHHTPDLDTLTLLCVAMTAHIDGYMAGYEQGYDAGVAEGKAIVTLGLSDRPEVAS